MINLLLPSGFLAVYVVLDSILDRNSKKRIIEALPSGQKKSHAELTLDVYQQGSGLADMFFNITHYPTRVYLRSVIADNEATA